MNVRAVCEGSFELPLATADAVRLFIPEGERRWAGPHWQAVYPVLGAEAGDAAPGRCSRPRATAATRYGS